MTASDILRVKFQSNRQMAIYTDRGSRAVINSLGNAFSEVYSGMERALWYTSCLTNHYANVCEELKAEETRISLSIYSIYRYRDVIAFMINLYIEKVLHDVNGKESCRDGDHHSHVIKNKEGSVRDIVRKTTQIAANRASGKSAREGLSYAISHAIARSSLLSQVVVERVSSVMPFLFLGLQLYGVEQKAALAARKLKVI